MSHAKRMWDTAAAPEHNDESASASECRLAADAAAATEHSEESANAFERNTTAHLLPMHRCHCHGAASTSLCGAWFLIFSFVGAHHLEEFGDCSECKPSGYNWYCHRCETDDTATSAVAARVVAVAATRPESILWWLPGLLYCLGAHNRVM